MGLSIYTKNMYLTERADKVNTLPKVENSIDTVELSILILQKKLPQINNMDIFFLLGVSAFQSKDYAKAKFFFKRAYSNGVIEACLFLGIIEEICSNDVQAEDFFMNGLINNLDVSNYLLGNLELNRGHFEKSLFFHKKAITFGINESYLVISHLVPKIHELALKTANPKKSTSFLIQHLIDLWKKLFNLKNK